MASGLLFALILSGLLAAASGCEEKKDCPASCPFGWTQFHCHCYYFNYKPKNWIDAENYCVSIGGNLAPIHNLEEHNFIIKYITTVSGAFKVTWIGGTDAVQEGTWLWSDGSNFDFTRWYTAQPSNSASKEHCLELYGGNYWNDRICTARRPFLCAQDAKHDLCCHDYGRYGQSNGAHH